MAAQYIQPRTSAIITITSIIAKRIYCTTLQKADTRHSEGMKWKAKSHTGRRISEKGREDTGDKWEQEEWDTCLKDASCIEGTAEGSCVSLCGTVNEWRILSRKRVVRENEGWEGGSPERVMEEEMEWVMRRWRQRQEEKRVREKDEREGNRWDTQGKRDKCREKMMRKWGEANERRGWVNTQIHNVHLYDIYVASCSVWKQGKNSDVV